MEKPVAASRPHAKPIDYHSGKTWNEYSGTAFQIAARFKGLEKSLQAGEYAFSSKMSTIQVIEMLARGETAYYQFTIPEGFTVEQIAELLQEKGLTNKDRFLSLARNFAPFEYMENRPGTKYRVEGYLFPDTYRVSRGMSEEDLLRMLISQFDRAYSPEMRDKAKLAGISVHNLVTLGSLVEREARLTQERPMVARVFLNRLKVDMPLQSCATIQYILGYAKEELTIADTQLPSPYNTYLNGGLPPGPVASPGLAALQAVLTPTDGDWLFFVVDGKTGGHRFSKTLAEHEAAIAKIGQ